MTTKPLRPGDRPAQSYREIQDARDAADQIVKPENQVPQQPPHSPWAQSLDELTGAEPPFGLDITAVEPCGTPQEVEASIAASVSSVPEK